MWICEECLEALYENEGSFMGSYGECDVCKQTKDCNEITRKNLIKKETVE